MKLKKWISGLIATTLLFGVCSTSLAAESSAKVQPQSKNTSQTKSLYTSDGNLLGTVVRDTTVTISKEGEDILFSVTEKNHYELEPRFRSIPEYQAQFADGTKTNKFRISENKLYLNGKLVDDNQGNNGAMTLAADTGGEPAFSHYRSNNAWTSYTFSTYSDVNYYIYNDNSRHDHLTPSGSHITKNNVLPTNAYFSRACAAMDSFKNNYDNFHFNHLSLIASAGTTAISWPSIVGLIGGGTATAFLAASVINDFSNCESDIGKAYDYVKHL